jgi:ribonuclease HI
MYKKEVDIILGSTLLETLGRFRGGRCGGTIHDPRGNHIVNYALGLGNVSNDLAEDYSLWCGLVIANVERIKTLILFGDSLLVIRDIKETYTIL